MTRVGKLLCVALPLALCFSACARRGSSMPSSGDPGLGPGPLLAPSALGDPLLWRQRVTASWGERGESFDAVLQLHAGQLTLVGMGPLGRPGFVVTQDESGVRVDNRSGRALPFAPDHIIADVQKVFYPWLAPVPAGFTGTRTGRHGILSVEETYRLGRLRSREFQRSDATERGSLRVTYEGWREGFRAPERARLENAWFGYTLTILTVEEQSLGGGSSTSAEADRR